MIPPLILVGIATGLLHRRLGTQETILVTAGWALLFGIVVGINESSIGTLFAGTAAGFLNLLVGAAVGAALLHLFRTLGGPGPRDG